MTTTRRQTGTKWREHCEVRKLRARLNGGVERPHWSAQIEDVKNHAVSRVLDALGWEPRIQTYVSYGSTSRVRILARVLYAAPSTGANHHNQPVYNMRSLGRRGFRNFTSQNDPFREIDVLLDTLDGPLQAKVRADRSGLIDAMIEARMAPGLRTAVLRAGPGNEVEAELFVFDPTASRVGVVSDIDDTVMITLLPRPLIAAWNAFVIDQSSRRIVPGMPVLYQQLRRQSAHESMPFIYLSTGAWNVSPFLQRFLFKNGYPRGPLLLTDWGPTNTGFFRSGREHKERSLERVRELFPELSWVLIGDDGQHDPQIYSDFVVAHPEAVEAVAIRELTDDQQDLAHGATRPIRAVSAAIRTIAAMIPRVWHRATDGDWVGTDTADGIPDSPDAAPGASIKARPTDLAARTGVPWVSGPDGFALIKALRTYDVMESPHE